MDEVKTQRVSLLLDLIATHPGTTAETEWSLLGRVYSAYQRNAGDLISLIAMPHEDSMVALEIMREEQQTRSRENYMDELFRFLLNYTASASALVDHSRNLMRDYSRSQFYFAYQNRVALLSNLGVARFVQDLRNYLLHHRVPPISVNLHFTSTPNDLSFTVTLNRDRMLQWGKWKPQSKSDIRGHEEIVLRQSVEEYTAAISELYNWLFTQFSIVHAEDLSDVERLKAEARELLGWPDDLRGFTGQPNSG